jgi:hypothetical protein
MTRMAEGIEKSEFVLVAMSEHYEKSRYCRSEATYAYKSERCIIPLKFQCAFKATGWLGMTVGDLLYIDFSEERLFDAAYKELIEQIDRYKQPKESGMFKAFELNKKICFSFAHYPFQNISRKVNVRIPIRNLSVENGLKGQDFEI